MFEAALASIEENFPPGTLAGDKTVNHSYVADSGAFGSHEDGGDPRGFGLAQHNSSWGFELDVARGQHAMNNAVYGIVIEVTYPASLNRSTGHYAQPLNTMFLWRWVVCGS